MSTLVVSRPSCLRNRETAWVLPTLSRGVLAYSKEIGARILIAIESRSSDTEVSFVNERLLLVRGGAPAGARRAPLGATGPGAPRRPGPTRSQQACCTRRCRLPARTSRRRRWGSGPRTARGTDTPLWCAGGCRGSAHALSPGRRHRPLARRRP